MVIDTSMALAWGFPDEGSESADAVLLALEGQPIIVPAIWVLEITNAILVAERRKRLKRPETLRFVALIEELSIIEDRQTVSESVSHILPLAREHGLSAYDAAYLELAVRHNARLHESGSYFVQISPPPPRDEITSSAKKLFRILETPSRQAATLGQIRLSLVSCPSTIRQIPIVFSSRNSGGSVLSGKF